MNSIIQLAQLLGIFTLGSCASLSPDQRTLVDEARSIERYPVGRTAAIRRLGLSGLPSKRDGQVINSGYFFIELWAHPSGLFVSGDDGVPIESKYLTRRTIDRLLETTVRSGREFGQDASLPRPTFERIVITNFNGRIVFDSSSAQEIQRRTAANRTPTAARF